MEKKFEIESSTGKKIAGRIWRQERKEYKGIIQLVHGMQEHIGRYTEFAEFLSQKGYIVIGHDHLGHGETVKNEEEYGHFSDKHGWSNLVDDIHKVQAFAKKEYPDLKYTIFGHSMGSLLVRTYITKYKDKIDKVIICGTSGKRLGIISGIFLIKLMKIFLGKKYKSELIEYLVTGSFNKKFNPNRTVADWTSRDQESVDEFISDKKCLKNFTLQAYEDLLKGSLYVSKQKNVNKSIKVPILITSGDKDPVGENAKGVIRVYKMFEKGNYEVDIRLFKDARHELLNEINKEEVFCYILNWIEK